MSYKETKKRLESVITCESSSVNVLSGPWGSGKTYLWNQIKNESQSETIKNSLYTSLYGIKGINEFKASLAKNILGKDNYGSTLRNQIGKKTRWLKGWVEKLHPSISLALDVSDIILPYYLRSNFVVIDDIERMNERFDIDELLGFINEYSSLYKCRFLLIMNGDEINDKQSKVWKKYKEKFTDFELKHTISPDEAFDIAAVSPNIIFRDEVKGAIIYCEINNIRVISKLLNLTTFALSNHENIQNGALSKVIPAIVLTGAVFHNSIKHWASVNDLIDFIGKVNSHESFLSSRDNDFIKSHREAIDFLHRLNVKNDYDIISKTQMLLESALTDRGALKNEITLIVQDELSIITERKYHSFVSEEYWNYHLSKDEVRGKANQLLANAKHLDVYQISNLINSFKEISDLADLVDEFRHAWLTSRRGSKIEMKRYEAYDSVRLRIDEEIFNTLVDIVDDDASNQNSVFFAFENQYKLKGWGEQERFACRNSTPETLEHEIKTLEWIQLKQFDFYVSSMKQNDYYEESTFEMAVKNYIQACRNIISEDSQPKLTKLLKLRLEHLDIQV